jgi:hypothetical protein
MTNTTNIFAFRAASFVVAVIITCAVLAPLASTAAKIFA